MDLPVVFTARTHKIVNVYNTLSLKKIFKIYTIDFLPKFMEKWIKHSILIKKIEMIIKITL